MNFTQYIDRLKLMTFEEDGFRDVLKELSSKVKIDSEWYNPLIVLIGSHKNLDKTIINGVLDLKYEQTQIAKIRGKVKHLIKCLEPKDLNIADSEEKQLTEIGTKDLPTKALISIGKMTPELASSKIVSIGEMFREFHQKFKKVASEKERKASIASKKLKSIKKSNITDIRIQKKYINEFADAFKEMNRLYKELSGAISNINKEYSMLSLYLIEHNYSSGNLNKDHADELIDISLKLTEVSENVYRKICEGIDEKKLLLVKYKAETKKFQIRGKTKKMINSEILMKDAYIEFIEELKIMNEAYSYYRNNLDN